MKMKIQITSNDLNSTGFENPIELALKGACPEANKAYADFQIMYVETLYDGTLKTQTPDNLKDFLAEWYSGDRESLYPFEVEIELKKEERREPSIELLREVFDE